MHVHLENDHKAVFLHKLFIKKISPSHYIHITYENVTLWLCGRL